MNLFEILCYVSVAVLIIAMVIPDKSGTDDPYEYIWQK